MSLICGLHFRRIVHHILYTLDWPIEHRAQYMDHAYNFLCILYTNIQTCVRQTLLNKIRLSKIVNHMLCTVHNWNWLLFWEEADIRGLCRKC